MAAAFEQKLEWLKNQGHAPLLKGILHGIEKEGLRVDLQGQLAETDHPTALGSALTHSHITTDYSEALLEFITPVFKQSGDALTFLADLHQFTYANMNGELIWSASMPCHLPDESAIPIARYGSSNVGTLKSVYREGLNFRYGKMMQTIAGIHYNFSLPEALWPEYQVFCENQDRVQDFRSAQYFTLIRNFRRYSWLLLYLFGASPALSKSFMKDKPHALESLDDDTFYLPYATSLRMSDLGYSNKAQASLNICFNHLATYAESLHQAINTPYAAYEKIGVKVDGQYRQLNTNILQIENEYYSDIRPKRVTHSGEKPLHALRERGVEYIEVRNTDINPFLPLGIDQTQADFIDLFLITCLLAEDAEISNCECERIHANHDLVVTRGREPGLMLQRKDDKIELTRWGHELLDKIQLTADMMDQVDGSSRYSASLSAQRSKLDDPSLTPSAQVLKALQDDQLSYEQFVLQQSAAHRETLLQHTLSEEAGSYLQRQAEESLQEQAEIEARDNQDFDQFLAEYLAG
ncbi:glutamate--cysteine ligase [Pontibacterium granulatum]|uniref:glutamate--cysteine ligase n=1 Tax=Pontibacterium granulatum TaxID=2036029 RepID=UPI00249BB107|nr:glutamate--cysteine ligase [Pontibacterium granulatum]MDI3325093.1 glutamate--cysteine ligase [Pontibacterium granulatum]